MLTKNWLMGVRRGWLSLMKPDIRTYADVERAFCRLETFVQNIGEQVFNVRRTMEREKVDAALEKLLAAVLESKSTAKHWQDAYEGKTAFPSEEDRRHGEQMLGLYRDNFEVASARSKRKRGGGGLSREATLTEFFDGVLKLLYADAAFLADRKKVHDKQGWTMDVADPVFREFYMQGMKIVIVDPKHRGGRIRAYIEPLERVYKDLARKGFKSVWYGTVFIASDANKKMSPEEKSAYAEAGYAGMEASAGTYHSGDDTVRITTPPEDVERTLVHEMGHRYWFKIMSKAQRARFESLIDGDWSIVHALLLNRSKLLERTSVAVGGTWWDNEVKYLQWVLGEVERGADLSLANKTYIRQRARELGLRTGVDLVSSYARSRPTEAFAEVFERYVNERAASGGRDLTRDQVESFRSVLVRGKGGGGARAAEVVRRAVSCRSGRLRSSRHVGPCARG